MKGDANAERKGPSAQEILAQLEAANDRLEQKAGRNLPLAIAVGVLFGSLLLVSLIFVKVLFAFFCAAVVAFASVELAAALRLKQIYVPKIGVAIAGGMLPISAYFLGGGAAIWAFLAAVFFVWLWYPAERFLCRKRWDSSVSVSLDLGASAFVITYIGFLASFAVFLTGMEGGEFWTLAFVIITIVNDTGAYASGVLFGKHPMAPRISPKKTWEGLAGAVVATLVAAILLALFMLDQPWWFGVIFAVVTVCTATLGDLAESVIKRNLGTKDMSSWLPGHGGILDRLDSMLFTSPAALVLYLIFVG